MPQAVGTRGGGRGPRLFPARPAAPDLPAIDREVLGRWEAGQVLARSLARTAGGPRWTCYEEPPAANGMPGAHHVPALAIRDLYRRFKTMQGFRVPRHGGWSCHGLSVEVAVEKELGLAGPADIETYGVERFNARCRESALRHAEAFASLTTRLGCWVDPDGACRSMDARCVEWVWRSLRRIFDAGLLVREHRVVPYCPRCQTPASHADASQPGVRRTVPSQAVTVRVRLATLPEGASPWLRGADLLVWTTSPWTLAASAAIAVHPHQRYAIARRPGHDDRVVVAESLARAVLGEGWHITARVTGAEVAGATYEPLFDLTGDQGAGHVISGYFVRADTGTGITHVAPALGVADLAAGRAHGLGVITAIGPDGCFDRDLPLVGGTFCTDADPILIGDLADRGLIFSQRRHERTCPHCWRCGTPLLDYALRTWYLRTSAVAGQLLADSQQLRWEPPGSRDGRHLEWLAARADWALSRSRYWGTPLPLWECEHGHLTCAGSLAELSELAGADLAGLDPHRPQIDLVIITCPDCGAPARRVPDVVDSWYDSGAMPFALHGEPPDGPAPAGAARFGDTLPAHLAASAADPATGWLYSLMAISRLVFGRPAVRTVLRLRGLADESGRMMSQCYGNVVEPLPLIERFGADAIRWFFAASPPSAGGNVGPAALAEVVRKPLLTYWHVVAFFVRNANAAPGQDDRWRPRGPAPAPPPPATRPLLDRWLLSELQALIGEVTADLEGFRPEAAGRRLASFIDGLSTWYLRRSRGRFRCRAAVAERAAALATLHECLDVLTRLMAPVIPFLADYVWQVIREPDAPDSVHLAPWPVAAPSLIDARLARQMTLARRLTRLGRAARSQARVRLRQPLAAALVTADEQESLSLTAELRAHVADELNVRSLEFLATAGGEGTSSAQDVIARRTPPAGWAVASDGLLAVAVDVAVTPELRREGIARDMIRAVQDARKAAGLDAGDRIALHWSVTDRDVARALIEHGPMISDRVLAGEYGPASAAARPGPGTRAHAVAGLGLLFWLRPLGTQARQRGS